MSGTNDALKEQLQKKSLMEIETMMVEHKRKISAEKNLVALHRLSTELSIMQEIREQKQRESGPLIRKSAKSSGKADLKSFDDYVRSKK